MYCPIRFNRRPDALPLFSAESDGEGGRVIYFHRRYRGCDTKNFPRLGALERYRTSALVVRVFTSTICAYELCILDSVDRTTNAVRMPLDIGLENLQSSAVRPPSDCAFSDATVGR